MHTIHWFEIPVRALDRAVPFYEAVLATRLRREDEPGSKMAIFPTAPGTPDAVTGCLVESAHLTPGAGNGTVIYLATPDPGLALARAVAAGAAVVTDTRSIGPNGTIAVFRDLDGNVVGLHAEA